MIKNDPNNQNHNKTAVLGIKQFNFFVFIFNRKLFAGMWLESRVFIPHNLTSTECEETSVTEDMGIFSLADVLSGSTRDSSSFL
jgi:hypothetical protein